MPVMLAPPKTLFVTLGLACNLRCRYCDIGRIGVLPIWEKVDYEQIVDQTLEFDPPLSYTWRGERSRCPPSCPTR